MNKRHIWTLVSIITAAIFVLNFAGCGKTVAPDAVWEVTETTHLSVLTVGENAVIKAPEGKSLTMTVDGVETPISPGSYKGDIVLTPAENIIVDWNGMGAQETYLYRAAVYVDENGYSAEKSVTSAVVGGEVTDTYAKDIKITSVGDKFNGIMVTGNSKYAINNPVIQMTGNGGNDFAGYGASIMTDDNAQITIENAKINNTGAVRPAIWTGGDSMVTVNNSDIETHSGTLPSDYSFSWVNGDLGKGKFFMEVPWMLGCVGNTRSTILMANGRAYFNDSHIKAYGWGALSTDQVGSDAVLYVTNCLIETIESGYGSFADGSANTYSGCTFNVVDYGLIMQRGSAHFTDGTVVNSDRLGVMTYSGDTILTIDEGCVFNTKKAAIQVKGGSPDITVDNAQLNSESGVIFQAMLLDDPIMVESGGSIPDGSGGDQSAGAPGAVASGGMAPSGGMPPEGGMPPGGGMPGGTGGTGGGMPGAAAASGTKVTFRNVTLNGDIITSMTNEGDVNVTLEKSTITGAITTSIAEHAKGPNGEKMTVSDETDLYYLIGEVIDTYSATKDKFGMNVSLDGKSEWIVDETSYLTRLSIAEGAVITAPEGYEATLAVDGIITPIKAGTYLGDIVVSCVFNSKR